MFSFSLNQSSKELQALKIETVGIHNVYHDLSGNFEKNHNRNPYYLVLENLDTGEQHETINIFSSPFIYTNNVLSDVHIWHDERYEKSHHRYDTGRISYSTRTKRIEKIQTVIEALRASIKLFSGNWKFHLKPVSIDTFSLHWVEKETGESWNRDKYNYEQWKKRLEKKLYPRFIRQNARTIAKAEKHIEQQIRKIMIDELPKLKKLDEILETLVRVESDYQIKFDELTERAEKQQKEALDQQRLDFEKRLETEAQEHQKQLIEMHETIHNLQDLIDKNYQQNELLLKHQKDQAKGYENKLFDLLDRLKNE